MSKMKDFAKSARKAVTGSEEQPKEEKSFLDQLAEAMSGEEEEEEKPSYDRAEQGKKAAKKLKRYKEKTGR